MILSLIERFAAACSGVQVDGTKFCTELPGPDASATNIQNIVHIVVAILAAIAVLIIVISALNIVTAGGDPAKVAKARSAIIYSIVGIIIVVIADAIVALIIGKL
jgi:cytochrome bd-type quinol oxidase subunit 1